MKENTNNARLTALKKGQYIELTLMVEGIDTTIKVNDYGGKQKDRARKLTYKIYKALGGK